MRSGSVPDDIFTSVQDPGARDTVSVPVLALFQPLGHLLASLFST